MNTIGPIQDKNILFLQGPMGPFFKKLDIVFRKRGAKTYKIGLNAGDWFYSNKDNYIPYKDTKQHWKIFIENFLIEKKIDKIFLFGDCRFYQNQAVMVALSLKIDIFVFEEGYVRPHYITMEKFGVNDYSHIEREANFYQKLKAQMPPTPLHAQQSKTQLIISAMLYYLLANIFSYRYPCYEHHREFSAVKEGFYAIRGLWRKLIYHFSEANYLKQIEGELSKQYFFVPLQTHNDFQILQHSNYGSVEKFIIDVLESFAKYADQTDWLVFKHHPVDRGRRNYHSFITEQARVLAIANRVLIIHDVHLPTCLKHAKGTVTINSTVGLSSIGHQTPTITLGNAIYDIEGLTCKGMELKRFWKEAEKPDRLLYQKFITYLIEKTQLNGSYYGLFPHAFFSDEMYQ